MCRWEFLCHAVVGSIALLTGFLKIPVMKRTDALKIVKQLYRKHKLDKRGWTFAFVRAVERLGGCGVKHRPAVRKSWATARWYSFWASVEPHLPSQ